MTAMAFHQVQEAVFSALIADTALQERLTGIYDEAPSEARYPYLTMGDTNASTNDLKDITGAQISFNIALWSNEPSQMQVKELMEHTDKILHRSKLIIVGYDLLTLQLQTASVTRQWIEEGSLYKGILSYTAQVYSQ